MPALDSDARVFAVPAAALADFCARPEFCADPARVGAALDIVRRRGAFYPRAWAETTEAICQVIPCAIVRNGGRLLRVRRAKKGRGDLRLRHTLLFGGHVEAADAAGGGDMLRRCAARELREELGLRGGVGESPIGVVADPATAASRRHFGVVFECRVAGAAVSVSRECDGGEFANGGRDNVYPLAEADEFAGDDFDPWSELLLASDFARRNLGRGFAIQPPLALATGSRQPVPVPL